MKHLGKRVLSMVLALGITTSMLVSDVSAMQVYAAGSTEFVDEETTVELLSEELKALEEDNSVEEVSESVEESSEESEEEPSGEIEDAEEESSMAGSEETTEAVSSDEETSETEAVSTEEKSEEMTSATEEADSTEEITTEEISTEEVTTEEATETVVEETTEEATTEMAAEFLNAEGVAAYTVSKDKYNVGFTLGADPEGRLTVTFDEGVEEIEGKVEIPAEVKIIPRNEKWFDNNTKVEEVKFAAGSQLTTIEASAFQNTSITSITLPKSLTYIGNNAFKGSYLTKVVLTSGGENVEIGNGAFENNQDLQSFYANERISVIGERAFYNDKDLEGTVELGNVEVISKEAFAKCESLEYINIPSSVEYIEENAFEDCKTLGRSSNLAFRDESAVLFGEKVKEIKDSAFKGCSGLTYLELPASVEELGRDVFNECTALKTIVINNVSGSDSTNACAIKLTYTSFPNLKGLVLKAYDGTVEDWVGSHTSYGVKFSTLYEEYAVTIGKFTGGTVTANMKTAKMGDTVTLTVKPASGYVLKADTGLFYKCDNSAKPELIDTWDMSFTMPESDVTIYADFAEAATLEYGSELVLADLHDETSESISYDDNVLTFTKPWQSVRIEVSGENGEAPIYSQLKFTSSNSKAVTVDGKGNIRAIAPNASAKITVALTNKNYATEPLVFNVKVGEETYVNTISIDYTAQRADIEKYGDANAEEANEIECDIITYPSSLLNISARTITIEPEGKDESGDTLDVAYQMTSNDTSIAKPNTAKFTGKGTITVPKGALGETVVTVKAVDNSDKPKEKQFVIRVIDDTPRLAESTIKVDPLSDQGTLIDLVSVYGGEPEVGELSIQKKVVSKGNTVYVEDDIFELHEESGNLYLMAPDPEGIYTAGRNYTYKNTYYIHGTLKDTDAEFYVAIPTLTICKKNIKPSVKMSGKINLFYNGKASEAQLGSVMVTQNQKDLIVDSVELVGNEKTNGVDEADDLAFTENFDIQFDKEKQTIKIIRKLDDEALSCYTDGKSKGKPVLAGKLSIKYVGYEKPFEVQITVPTHTTAPTYTLDKTKISLNTNASGQKIDVKFINKKTKEVENLSGETIIKVDSQDSGTTDGLIYKNGENFSYSADDDIVHLKVQEPKKGKIVLVLRQPEWEDQSGWNKKSIIKATISVSATNAFPTAKLAKTTLTVNAACPDATDYTTMVLNQEDSELLDTQEFEAIGRITCDVVQVRYDGISGKVIAEITGTEDIKPGTYSYRCEPHFTFDGEDVPEPAKAVTVKVVVKNTAPSIKLKKSSFTLNAKCYKKDDNQKYDFATTTFDWVNLPTEYEGYELATDNMELFLKANGKETLEEKVKFEINEEDKMVKVYSEYKRAKGTYVVKGLQLKSGDDVIDISPVTFTLKSTDNDPTVTVSAKGTINPLDPASKIEYTSKIANINGSIVDVKIIELDEDGTALNDDPAVETEHFKAKIDEVTGKTVVRVRDGVTLENRTYKIQLYYELSNGTAELYRVAKDQKITPKQTMPKITADTKSATFFAGDKSRTTEITVKKTSTATADISNIKFSSKTPLLLQNAFVIENVTINDDGTCQYELRLKNSAFIQQNKEQTLTFEIECNGQLKDTTGTTFTVKVKVIK